MLSICPRALLPAPFEEHYSLTQQPFGLTLDQRFVYPSRSYTTALNDVRLGLQRREGLVVVTGASVGGHGIPRHTVWGLSLHPTLLRPGNAGGGKGP